MEFANRLITARRAKGLSQEALAETLHLSRQAISKWETGESRPDLDNLICLCKALDISVEHLCFGTEAPASIKQPAHRRSIGKRIAWIIAITVLAIGVFFLGMLYGKSNANVVLIENTSLDSLQIVDAIVTKDGDATLHILLNTVPDGLSMDLLVTNANEPAGTSLPCKPDGLQFCAVLSDPVRGIDYHISAVLKLGGKEKVLPLLQLHFDTVYETFSVYELWNKT